MEPVAASGSYTRAFLCPQDAAGGRRRLRPAPYHRRFLSIHRECCSAEWLQPRHTVVLTMRTPHPTIRLAIVLLATTVTGSTSGTRIIGQAEPPIAVLLRKVPASAAHAAFEEWLPAVSRFYAKRNSAPAWTTGNGWSPAGDSVLRVLRGAADDGLNPDEYNFPAFTKSAGDADALARLDVLMSLAVVRYARDLGWGVTLPSEVDTANDYDERAFAGDDRARASGVGGRPRGSRSADLRRRAWHIDS